MGSGSLIKLVITNFDILAGPVISLVYPLYASVRAIETRSRADDQQWLTYWVLYSFITLFELTFSKFIELLPFWSYAKLTLNCWLVLPYFSGAAYFYEHYVRPVLVTRYISFLNLPGERDSSKRSDDIMLAAEKFMRENGPEALEKLISKSQTEKSSAKFIGRRSNILDEVHYERETGSKSGYHPIFDDDYRF
ncbi:HVA22-like protein a [Wolffia australiana]